MKKLISTVLAIAIAASCQTLCFAQTKLTYFDTAVLTGSSNTNPDDILREVVELAKSDKDTQFTVTVDRSNVVSDYTNPQKLTLKGIIKAKANIGR